MGGIFIITKVSEITFEEVAEYIRVDDYNINQFETFLNIAKNYISSYTGIPIESDAEGVKTLDDYPDMIIAVYIICQDLYDNRSLYSEDSSNINKTVKTILDMHTRNNL